MERQFRGKNVSEAISRSFGLPMRKSVSERQIQRCRVIDSNIKQLGGEIDQALREIASISDEMKRRIEQLGNRDKIAVLNLGGVIVSAGFGLAAVYQLAIRAVGINTAGAAALIALEAGDELNDLISAIFGIEADLNALAEAVEISGPRRQLSNARSRIEHANFKLSQFADGYRSNNCQFILEDAVR